ncbi:asparagine synthase (glutamine-hydrolyzing) [Roseimaritima ulvae]|uniref:asparagine synthase (glutamine-hydrolyzing) n=1 Tax=Roseimaritima ulvae TaxID=980254 RepID=A0A5B9QIW7_9BACT|nr:asparagine synthase (glutamine-hydrolyzing) [Roseimaritima ulvae]QEG38978.1 Asparagine synthetase [glutamine-hydrolyzing] 1 [Roseimaritima ulvae]
MCGIAGILDPSRTTEALGRSVRAMNQAIKHRGPDDFGCHVQPGVAIGMRRLSIIDVAGGQQPLSNESGDIHVVCNGEIYNFADLRRDLQQRGHRFSSGSDAEVIVHLYEEYGDDCLHHLRGMFALAILDHPRQRLLIARDRLGKKPLFYAHRGNRFSFGSEMKSLLVDAPELSRPDYRSLGHFLQFAYIHEPHTIYEGIQRLPAAHFGVFDLQRGTFRIAPYWSVCFEPDDTVSEPEWAERLDACLAEAVRLRLHSEVPLGVFLSGGLDSSAVVAYASAAGLKPLKTFTIGFDRDEWDESEDAQAVAAHYGTEHHLLRLSEAELGDRFADTLQAVIRHCDEPFGDASAIPTYHISQLARQHVTVILSGDGGDELFAGYSSYRGALFAQAYRRRLPYWLGRYVLPALATTAAHVLPGRRHFQALRVAKVLRDSSLPILQAYRDKTSIWSVPQLRCLLNDDALASMDYMGSQYMPDAHWKILHSDRDLVSRLTEIDIRSYMLDDILVKVDRMSMAHALEVRSPLLDHRVVELAAQMPTSVKISGSQGKHILRKVLADKLPPRAIRKGKQGFSVPLRDWFRGRLREFVHDTLATDLPSELFNPKTVRQTLAEHQRGTVDHANRIWLLLTFASWYSQYVRGGAYSRAEVDRIPAVTAEASRCES